MTMIAQFTEIVGASNVLTGEDVAGFARDWTGKFEGAPAMVLRPGSTQEVSRIMQVAHATNTPIVAAGGRTGLTGATHAPGGVVLSLERMTRIEEINVQGRTATVEAGVIQQQLHDAAEAEGLIFPMIFGARGAARIGGMLATNAGGSNVLRYGNCRDLCLGVEAVLADGRVINAMSPLHKDNSGYDLRHLLIGSEGTLAIITRAVLKLAPAPKARATAMIAAPSIAAALPLLHRLNEATDGCVDAFEYMPRIYIDWYMERPGAREPFADKHDINILIELAATSERLCQPDASGEVPLTALLMEIMADLMEQGAIVDAVVAQSDAQRTEMWERREAAGEICFTRTPLVDTDIAVPLDQVEPFLTRAGAAIREIDPEVEDNCVAHLGDGNIHYTMYPSRDDPALKDRLMELVEGLSRELGGTFSAEHGVGLSKLPSMRRRQDPVALETMRAIKAALDPKGLLNPGKLLPPSN